jgi:hypothetical protein
MSRVTGVVLCCSVSEHPTLIDEINRWLANAAGGLEDPTTQLVEPLPGSGRWRLEDCADRSGGDKHPQMCVLVGGLNYFGATQQAFANFALGLPWDEPQCVVLIFQPEDEAAVVMRPPGATLVSER